MVDEYDAFQLNCRNHNGKRCDKCVFRRHRVRWEEAARPPGSEKSWLMPRPFDSEDVYLSCGPCEAAVATNTQTPAVAWRVARLPRFRGRMVQLQSLTRRSQPALRQQACRFGGGEVMDAPPLEEFEVAWEAAAGSSGAAGTASEISKI